MSPPVLDSTTCVVCRRHLLQRPVDGRLPPAVVQTSEHGQNRSASLRATLHGSAAAIASRIVLQWCCLLNGTLVFISDCVSSKVAMDLPTSDDHWQRSLEASAAARKQAQIVEENSRLTHEKMLAAQDATRNFEKARCEHMAVQVRPPLHLHPLFDCCWSSAGPASPGHLPRMLQTNIANLPALRPQRYPVSPCMHAKRSRFSSIITFNCSSLTTEKVCGR